MVFARGGVNRLLALALNSVANFHRPGPSHGSGRSGAILQPPGTYTVTLSAGGEKQSQPLVILKDPSSGGSEETIAAQLAVERALARDLNEVVEQVNALEVVRGQIVALRELAGSKGIAAELKGPVDSIEASLLAVEGKLFQMTTTGRGQDFNRRPVRLAEQINYLADVTGLTDFAPTQSQRDVQHILHEQWLRIRPQVQAFLDRELPAFNERLRASGVRTVVP